MNKGYLAYRDEKYPKPISGEKKFVDYDDESAMWCVFGEESGHAYSSWASEEQANQKLDEEMGIKRT